MNSTTDHSRVSAEGKKLGDVMARMADAGALFLAADGEPDVRCKTCAYRSGTVPNGCLQTQMDATKATSEGVPFQCHHVKKGQRKPICHGWYAARVFMSRSGMPMNLKAPWEFSPPDEEPTT